MGWRKSIYWKYFFCTEPNPTLKIKRPGMDTDKGVLNYFDGLFKWIDSQTAEGRNVLIHCLAGAHRAGTTGVAYTMYAKKLPLSSALHHCKSVRPIVDPFGSLEDLLKHLE